MHFRAYISSRAYRELKLRGAVVKDGQLRILPLEQIYNTISGIWNLSSDQVRPCWRQRVTWENDGEGSM
jgi:hypothetical protein